MNNFYTENPDSMRFTQNNHLYSSRLKNLTNDERAGGNCMMQSQTVQSVRFDDDEKFDICAVEYPSKVKSFKNKYNSKINGNAEDKEYSLNKPPLDLRHSSKISSKENKVKDIDDSKSVTQADPIEFIKRENIVLVNEYSDAYYNNSSQSISVKKHRRKGDSLKENTIIFNPKQEQNGNEVIEIQNDPVLNINTTSNIFKNSSTAISKPKRLKTKTRVLKTVEMEACEVYQMQPKRLKFSSSTDIYNYGEMAPKVKDYIPAEDVYGSTLQNFCNPSLTESDAQTDQEKPTKRKRKIKKIKPKIRESTRINTEINNKLTFDMNWDDE